MAFVDVWIAAVPDANRAAFEAIARDLGQFFVELGAETVLDAWAADVPEGSLTSLPMAVQRQDGESVVVGWVRWPSQDARDAGWKAAEGDTRFAEMNPGLYDGKRMIFGGFQVIQETHKGE